MLVHFVHSYLLHVVFDLFNGLATFFLFGWVIFFSVSIHFGPDFGLYSAAIETCCNVLQCHRHLNIVVEISVLFWIRYIK